MKTKKWNKEMMAIITFASIMMLTTGSWTAFAAGHAAIQASPVGIQQADKGTAPNDLHISALSERYYQNHPTTIADIDRIWGKPVAVKTLPGGSEERYYKYDNKIIEPSYRYFLVKDGKVVRSASTATAVIGTI